MFQILANTQTLKQIASYLKHQLDNSYWLAAMDSRWYTVCQPVGSLQIIRVMDRKRFSTINLLRDRRFKFK